MKANMFQIAIIAGSAYLQLLFKFMTEESMGED